MFFIVALLLLYALVIMLAGVALLVVFMLVTGGMILIGEKLEAIDPHLPFRLVLLLVGLAVGLFIAAAIRSKYLV